VSQSPEGYINEYNQLRAEIRMYLEHSSKSLQIAMALGAAAVTFGPQYPNLLIVSSLIVLFLWYDEIRHLRAVQRVATYLEVFVEPNVPGLNWETSTRANPFEGSFKNRAIANAPFPTLVVAQALYAFQPAGYSRWLGLIGFGIVTCYLFGLSYLTAKHGRNTEREHWQAILRQSALNQHGQPNNASAPATQDRVKEL
jgi:hypothetical protein